MTGAADLPPSAIQDDRWPDRLAHNANWILAGIALVTWLLMRRIPPSHDIYWQFWVARQMLGGTRLYADIWEVNPPLWFWSALPIEWLAERLGIAWQSLLIPLMIALSAMSALLVRRLIDLGRPGDNLCLTVMAFWLSAVVPLAELGQREHFALMLCLPYAALIACRAAARPVPLGLALTVAALGAYGFALKHYFALVPLALEMWLWLRLRRAWRPARPETGVLAGCAIAYAASVLWLTPAFLTVALPIIRNAYLGHEAPMHAVVLQPWVAFWLASAGYLWAYRKQRQPFVDGAAEALFHALPIIAACFTLAYFIQQRGPYYQSLPTTGILAIAVGLQVLRTDAARAVPIVSGLALLMISLSTVLVPRGHDLRYVGASDALLGRVPAGEIVFVAHPDTRWAWPAIEQRRLVWPSRVSSMWMLPAIAESRLLGHATPAMQHMASQLQLATSEDIRCNPPALMIFPDHYDLGIGNLAFPVRDFFFADARLRQFADDNYVQALGPSAEHVYARRGPVRGIASPSCRTIR